MPSLLHAAEAQLEAADAEGAVDSLVKAWRTKRAPALADVIDLVSSRITRPSLVTKPLKKQWDQWRAVAAKRDPADLDRLVAVPLPRKWTEAEPLLNVLYDWPADPRFSRFLAQLVLSNAVYSRIGDNRANQVFGFYHRILHRLVQLKDTRVLAMLADVRRNESDVYGSWRTGIEEALAGLRRQAPVKLTTDEQRVIDSLRARFASQTSEREHTAETVEGLYAKICEHPDDDGLRAVFADLLTERGDVRGEFVTLQLQPQRDLSKEDRLIKKHATAFAGPLDGRFHREQRVFERGFLAGGELAGFEHANLTPADLEEPSWRLITTLDLPLRFDPKSLTHPNLAFVRKLELTEASLPSMLKREWPLTELIIGHWNDDRLPLPHPLSTAAQFPSLKVLGVHDIPDAAAVACRQWLPKAPVLKRLERVVLDIFATKFGPWWPDLTKSAIPVVQLGRAPGWVFTFTRDERGELGALHAKHDARNGIGATSRWNADTIEFWMQALLTALLPDALTSLTIEPSKTSQKLDRARLEQTLTRFPLLSRVTLPFD